MYTIKKQYRMTAEEIERYNALPDNLPDVRLTQKQKDFVSDLYYKYIGRTIDRMKWGKAMFEVEQEEKWPSGGMRLKRHEAQRIILNGLVSNQHKRLTNAKAAEKFKSCLTCRPMYAKLIEEIYTNSKD